MADTMARDLNDQIWNLMDLVKSQSANLHLLLQNQLQLGENIGPPALANVGEVQTAEQKLRKLYQLESTLRRRPRNQNPDLRNHALRRIELIWNSGGTGGTLSCWFPYVGMELFDCLPPLINEDVDLIVLSCLTLACKMNTKRFDTTNFLLERGLRHSLDVVVKMELHLLRLLDWIVKCFTRTLPVLQSGNLRLVYRIIMWTQADIRFAQFRPSAIASSAIVFTIPSIVYQTIQDAYKDDDQMEVEVGRCTLLMERVYGSRLNSQRDEPSSIYEEDSLLNIELEWMEWIVGQMPPIEDEDGVGLFERALGCIRSFFRCLQDQDDPPTETSSLSEDASANRHPLLPAN